MKHLKTDKIADFPQQVILSYSQINSDLSTDILSSEELAEWNSFTNDQRKNEFLTARHLFRQTLKDSFDSENYELRKHELGKPYGIVDGEEIFVSFSHSKEHVFCAVSTEKDIGIDTEWLDRKVDSRLVKRILGEEEWNVFSDEDPILLWTIKEAAVKCLGTGLRTNLKDLIIQKNSENRFSVKINNEKSFQICSFQELNHQISIAF